MTIEERNKLIERVMGLMIEMDVTLNMVLSALSEKENDENVKECLDSVDKEK